jgi:citrate synthase
LSEIPGQLPLFDLPGQPPAAERSRHLEQLRALLEERRTHNQRQVRELAARHRRQPPPYAVLLTRVNALADTLLGDDEQTRLTFELEFEAAMTAQIQDWLDEADQRSLLDPTTPLPTNGRPLIGGSGFIRP